MPDNKNQHYVPRAHLRPFTLNGAGLAINLVNIASRKKISNAPVKHQCAKDYLYGKEDLRLERHLQEIEGMYATTLRKVQEGLELNTNNLDALRVFAWLQYCRTENAFGRLRNAMEMMYAATYQGHGDAVRRDEIDLTPNNMMLSSMLQFTKTAAMVHDLQVCIIENNTALDFFTSDDPSILTNRFLLQRQGADSIGVGSAGTLLFLPLTPRHMLMCYDADVYYFEAVQNQRLPLNRRADVKSLNQMQLMKAEKNIYHANPQDADNILAELETALPLKPASTHIIKHAVVTRENGQQTLIRPATEDEINVAPPKRRIIAIGGLFPRPLRWPNFLKYKLHPIYYDNGSLAGKQRLATAHEMHRRAWQD